MSPKNAVLLTILAALWGASFLFIRIGVAELGVAPLMALRVGIGALFLVGLALTRMKPADLVTQLRQRAWPLFVVGALNSSVPFCLFAFAELTLSAGVTSVINATAPLWVALVAYLWLKDKLSLPRALGLMIGFAGVLTLVWDQVANAHGGAGAGATMLAAAAALGATLLYGIAANYTKRKLGGVDPIVSATGSMIGSTVLLLPFAIATWPAAPVSAHAWGSVLSLGIACTGIAYFIYFHLIAHVGPARAITVTFVIPVFGLLWGALFLGERVSAVMLEGCAIVLVGTALATGVIRRIPGIRSRGGGEAA
ncbi:DMT family transporter [Burkholderia stagnalis]|uniref:DMT family transporter n=1 Tax=Burkholderia stagnalis TaxID=1503054 RepID=UPI0007524B96|nr:DMT family transporter [Burkholderia stagnalis]KVC65331.1 multidrug DMT transporter permease [Burkholderia stagnalis]KVN21163.1 multidrug DMT transporter permease [Burkholderia stagnalis]KWI77935.1 multidrug DMT transporter permease [Burkholderia stagnalis]KWK69955.1 multidrug DMT transporter permease [Burkholderia stagnalis]KWN19807.1 multidrug DMT transporter permease [Burkholderia stagnalis]